jgi:hypothetical protein
MKFEDFISDLPKTNDPSLPYDLLKEFQKVHLWAMIDPTVRISKLNCFDSKSEKTNH